ncbi:sodium-dependent nutrient amino acid transporter 1-like isoform X4 [Scylla paramamosain]|uniref:sodium-dependent nutrient amino acid transporter 1-like isoform X4 n=1 Tax=Scylla paramamosain TaxID=85552 RepID=UPI003082DD0D
MKQDTGLLRTQKRRENEGRGNHASYGGTEQDGGMEQGSEMKVETSVTEATLDTQEERQQWSTPTEFLLACITTSVGLGNVWRFPTTAFENGGGAFLIPYLLVLLFIGRPLYFLELVMGQFSSSGSVEVWRMVPAMKGIGYGQIIAAWSVVTYFSYLMGLTVFYLIVSFSEVLPWSVCDEAWADENCVDASFNYTSNSSASYQSSSEQYYFNFVLHFKADISDGIGLPDWRMTLCLLFSWSVIFLSLGWGVKSIGKVVYFTALFPYVVLVTLLVRGAMLPGATTGMLYYIFPQWRRLLDPGLFSVLFFLMMFTLCVGSIQNLTGSIITIITDQYPAKSKFAITFGICAANFLFSLTYATPGGQWIFTLVDYFGGSFIIFILAIFETVAITVVYGLKNVLRDVKFMLNKDLGIYWRFSWYFCPVALLAILIYNMLYLCLPTLEGKPLPEAAYACGWTLAAVAISMVPVCLITTLYQAKGETFIERLRSIFRPAENWGPRKEVHRREWEKLQCEEKQRK